MRRTRKLSLVVGVGLAGLLLVPVLNAVGGEEEGLTLDQVPEAVRATILREAAGAKITEIERETENGKTVFEADFLRDGQEIEIQVAPDGTLLGKEIEQEDDDEEGIPIDQVPEPARKALRELAGPGTVLRAERDSEDGVIVYGAKWTLNGTKHEAAVTADGTLIETEEIIPVANAPAAVRTAIAKHFAPGAQVVVARKMIVVYEVEAKVDGKEKELLVFPTGQVREDTDDDGDDDDDDDD